MTHKINLFGEELIVTFQRYVSYNNISIQLFDTEDHLPFCTATVNPEYTLPEGHVAIKTWSENHGVFEALRDAGIISEPVDYIDFGFVNAPVCKLLVEIE